MGVPLTMQAAFIRSLGGPELIEVGELPVPAPGPTDVLVKVTASVVNHVDTFVRSGAYPTRTPFPFVIGRDLVGTVADAGPGVDSVRIGEQVWCNSLGHGGRQGSFAEYAVVPRERLYRLPVGVDPMDAAAVLHSAATAHVGLFRRVRLEPGNTVLVGGAAGAVGTALVQLATAAGAHVIATAAPRDAGWVRECGAETVLDYSDRDLVQRIHDLAPQGVDIWWDTSGHHDFVSGLPLVASGGAVVVMAGMRAQPVLPVGALYPRDLRVHGFAISNATAQDLTSAAHMINGLLASGALKARVGAVFPLSHSARAHAMVEEGSAHGKVLIRV